MEALDPGSVADTAGSGKPSPCKTFVDLVSEEVLGGRIKMRDLESIHRSEVMRSYEPQCSSPKESNMMACDESEISPVREHANSPTQVVRCSSPPVQDAACFDLEPVCGTQSSTNQGCAKPSEVDNSSAQGIVATTVNYNPFYPYKKLGQIKPTDASECGSTIGPVKESESLRVWKEMKQNGFMSSSRVGISALPPPKPRGRQPKKMRVVRHPKQVRGNELKVRTEIVKKEQNNRFAKAAAPSGLLSGLNPGIINHVRNSKQVRAIIEAIVQSERLDGGAQIRSVNLPVRVHEEVNYAGDFAVNPAAHPFGSLSRGLPAILNYSNCDDALTLKVPSSMAMTLETTNRSAADSFEDQHTVCTLSLKAATVALMWLELFEKDIRGRLTALKRSRKRVRNVIHIELPHQISKELSSNQENDISFGHSRETLNSHEVRWKCMFHQMDRALHEEGKQLECMLKEVQEMQFYCHKGLKHSSANVLPEHGLLEDFRLKRPEVSEPDRALSAAAASIYSTCNMIMALEDVRCF